MRRACLCRAPAAGRRHRRRTGGIHPSHCHRRRRRHRIHQAAPPAANAAAATPHVARPGREGREGVGRVPAPVDQAHRSVQVPPARRHAREGHQLGVQQGVRGMSLQSAMRHFAASAAATCLLLCGAAGRIYELQSPLISTKFEGQISLMIYMAHGLGA